MEELTKQKSRLTHHVFMVAAENRQLWSRLSRLSKTNKSLGSHLSKISDTLMQHPATQQPFDVFAYSLKDISNSKKCITTGDGGNYYYCRNFKDKKLMRW